MTNDVGSAPAFTLTVAELEAMVQRAVNAALEEARPAEPGPALLDRHGLARSFDCSPAHIDNLRQRGMPFVRLGEHPRFELESCLEWLRATTSKRRGPSLPQLGRRASVRAASQSPVRAAGEIAHECARAVVVPGGQRQRRLGTPLVVAGDALDDDVDVDVVPPPEFPPPPRACRVCGSSQDELEKTGEPWHWVEPDLCSACAAGGDAFDGETPSCNTSEGRP